jgi:hypothetical protein
MTPVASRATAQNSSPKFPPHRVTGRSDLLRRGGRRRRSGLRLGRLRVGSCQRARSFHVRLCLGGSVLCCPASLGLNTGAVGNQGPKLGRELLYSSLSFSFRLRGVGNLAPRLNDAAIGYGLFLLCHCFLSFSYCFLARIQFRFPLSKLCFSSRILLLAGADHCQRDEHRKDQLCFHVRSKL